MASSPIWAWYSCGRRIDGQEAIDLLLSGDEPLPDAASDTADFGRRTA
jgi:hypothetical protein